MGNVIGQSNVVACHDELVTVRHQPLCVDRQQHRISVSHPNLDHCLLIGRHVHVVAAALDQSLLEDRVEMAVGGPVLEHVVCVRRVKGAQLAENVSG